MPSVAGSSALTEHGEVVYLDLRIPRDEAVARMRNNHRRDIRRAQTRGLSAHVDTSDQAVDMFNALYSENMHRVGADAFYFFTPEYVRSLLHALAGNIHVLTVRDNADATICAGLFTELAGIVQYHLSGTSDAGLVHQPLKMLLDFARDHFASSGAHVLNLGGGVGGSSDSLFNFKAGFSDLHKAFWTLAPGPGSEVYRRVALNAGHPQVELESGYFPAYRA